MSQRLKGLSHEDATGVAEEVFAASDRFGEYVRPVLDAIRRQRAA